MDKNYSQNIKRYGSVLGSIVLAGSKLAQAQVIYTDETPDLVVDGTTTNIDINNDGQMDIGFNQTNAAYNYATLVTPSGSTAQVLKTGVADALSGGTSIGSSNTTWGSVDGLLESGWTGSGNFGGAGDKYLGVRFQISGEYHYGWVLINVPSDASNITIKSYAYQGTANTSLITGHTTTTAVDANIEAQVKVYPNPTANLIEVEGIDVLSLSVSDLNGVEVAHANSNSVDISNLAIGTYILNITSDQGLISRIIGKQ